MTEITVPKFEGISDTTSIHDWIAHTEGILELRGISKANWVALAYSQLTSTVASRYKTYTKINDKKDKFADWDVFIEYLQSTFGGLSKEDEANEKLIRISFKGKIEEFNTEFLQHAEHSGTGLESKMLVSIYRLKFNSEVQALLLERDPKVLVDAMKLTKNYFDARRKVATYVNNMEDDSMEIDAIRSINTQPPFTSYNNDQCKNQSSYNQNRNNRRNNNINWNRGNHHQNKSNSNQNNACILEYNWFKHLVDEDTFNQRIKDRVCIVCGDYRHNARNCHNYKPAGKV